MIRPGDRLPDVNLWVLTEAGPEARNTADLFGSRRIALFGVPAAFTRVCSGSHLPGFIARVDDFKAAGVDAVACIAVNDPFVVDAWAKHNTAGEYIEFYADGNREFTAALGLENDASARGQGIRSKRYSMLIDRGVVSCVNVEDVPAKAEISGAETLLAQVREMQATT